MPTASRLDFEEICAVPATLYVLFAEDVDEVYQAVRMTLTFYLGAAAVEFKQYAAYLQRRTAVRAAQLSSPRPN